MFENEFGCFFSLIFMKYSNYMWIEKLNIFEVGKGSNEAENL